MKFRICVALGLMATLSSCSTWKWLVEREDQEVIVKTDPPLADCTLLRDGIPIAHLYPTPGSVYIPKTRDAITVTCTKPGYQTASATNESGTNGATLLRVPMWPADALTGSDNKYESPFTVTLPKEAAPD